MKSSSETDIYLLTCQKDIENSEENKDPSSNLSKNQKLNFSLCDYDWLHIKRLQAVKKEELQRKNKKKTDRIRTEIIEFLKTDLADLEYSSPELSSPSPSPPASFSNISSGETLQNELGNAKRQYRLCGLLLRKPKRYLGVQNHRFIISSTGTSQKNSPIGQSPEEIFPEVDINLLYGRTEEVLAFLQGYKIPKIQNNSNDWTNDAAEAYCPVDIEVSECDLSMDNHTMKKSLPTISRRKRKSKFEYRDKYSTSDEDDDD